jgi:Bacteriophage T4 gp5 C-terminal trimerisation domain
MAVFDGSVKTPRRVADPLTDKQVSLLADLTLGAINTPAALMYPGTDVSVVHGDQQLHVDQNRFMKVGMNQDVTIGMNEVYLVDMNRTMTVIGNYTRDVKMNSLIDVTGNYTKNVICNYFKNVTGNSTNVITGFYSKSVTMDYTKTIIGSSTNTITGIYSKTVQSNYQKSIQGTSKHTVVGNYTKLLSSNYVKVVTGNSSVQVTSESTVNYVGNHSRTCGNNHKQYISGSNTYTVIGPTIHTEIDVTVTKQVDSHIDVHPTTLIQEKSNWFSSALAKGSAQAIKLDFSGASLSASILSVAVYPVYLTLYGSTNSCFLNKFEAGLVAGKVLGIESKSVFTEAKSTFLQNQVTGIASRLGIYIAKFSGGNSVACPLNGFAGVILGFNQFM